MQGPLKVLGWISLIAGLLVGFSRSERMGLSLSIAIEIFLPIVFAGFVSFVLFMSFAKVIEILERIAEQTKP